MDHPHDDFEAFALGGLDEVSAKRLLEHADQCPTCAVLLAEAMSTANTLEPTVTRSLAAPIDLRGALQPLESARRSAPKWSLWASGFAAAAAILALAVWNVNLRSNIPIIPVASLVHSHFLHHALHGSGGNAKVIQALDGSWLYLVADGLQPKSRYVLSETARGTTREVGEFTTSSSGQATRYWEQAPTKIQGFALNSGGTTQTPSELHWP